MRRVTVSALAAACLVTPPALAQPVTQGRITGVVTAAGTGEPLAGATVAVVGTTSRATTRADGRYTLAVPPGTYTVRTTLIGFAPLDVPGVVVRAGDPTTTDVRLTRQATTLSEVVTVGYGTQRRQDVTGAIASVNVDQVPTVSTSASVGQLLQGRVAGAQVVQNNGAPGGGVSIRVRGSNSITANSEPLYVIDGVPAYVGNGGQDPYQNPLASINPSDIENIEVLKDASATAIYGARGANGVVLITTKLGRRGENQVTLESNAGVQAPRRYLPMLDARQYAVMANEARVNSGQAPVYTEAQVAALGAGTDWQREVLRDDAGLQSHTVSVSGGDDRTRYFVSGALFRQDGVIRATGFRRYSGRANIERTFSERFRVGTNLTLSNVDTRRQITDNALNNATVMGALWFNPASPVRDSAGAYIQNSPVTFPVQNPVAFVNELQNERSLFSVVGNVFGEYRLAEGLRLRSSLGTTSSFDRTRYYAPRTTAIGLNTNGTAEQFSGQTINVVNENILSYARPLRGTDNLDVTAGFTVQTQTEQGLTGANQQFVTDITGAFDLGAGTLPTTDTNYEHWGILSYLGRANYSLLDRYVFTVSGRYDGSSRFGANSKWAFFPSGAFAWRVIQEPFLRGQRALSDLKLRVGYGVTGNQEIGLYQSLARLGSRNYAFGGTTVVGYVPAGAAPNPDLKWETTRQSNVGLDVGVLGGRLTASVDAYNSVTNDLLLSVTLPATSGFNSQLRNVGSVRNRGVELQLNGALVQRPRATWSTTFSLAANRNRVLDLGVADEIVGPDKGIGGQTGGTTVVIRRGEPIGSFVGYRTQGLYQEGDACPLTFQRPFLDCVPGEYRYVDANGDGRITGADRVVLGNGHPDFYGGLQNDVTLGRFRLNVFLQGSYGAQVLNGPAINIRSVSTRSNQTTEAMQRWTPTNTNTSVPRANAARSREIYDVHVEDGSFLRLQSVTLGYQLPPRLVPGASNARVYVTGENLHVWTRYTGYDPEVNSFGGNAVSRGIDLGAYPRARSVTAGVSLGF